jgi:hypothetical protein
MESALIRGNNSWMSPLLPKINPNATSAGADFGFLPASRLRLPHPSKDPLLPELRSLRSALEMARVRTPPCGQSVQATAASSQNSKLPEDCQPELNATRPYSQ